VAAALLKNSLLTTPKGSDSSAATKNDLFGYGATNGNGRNELAYRVHTMLTFRPTAFLSFDGFYAHALGPGRHQPGLRRHRRQLRFPRGTGVILKGGSLQL
jgi:hypothetical protein